MVGRICLPGGDSVEVSENLGATAVVPVTPVDTSLTIIQISCLIILTYYHSTCTYIQVGLVFTYLQNSYRSINGWCEKITGFQSKATKKKFSGAKSSKVFPTFELQHHSPRASNSGSSYRLASSSSSKEQHSSLFSHSALECIYCCFRAGPSKTTIVTSSKPLARGISKPFLFI